MSTWSFPLPFGQQLQPTAGCSSTVLPSTGKPHAAPWGFHPQQNLFLSWSQPGSVWDTVHQLPRWQIPSSAGEHLLVLGAMGNGPESAVAMLESRCGQDGQPLWLSAGTFSQAASGHVSLASAGPWVGGSGGVAVPMGLMHVCYVTAALQKQDSKSSTPSGTPQCHSEPRHLEHSHALSRTPPVLVSPMSACEKPSHTCFTMNLFSQARPRFRNTWSTKGGCQEVEFMWGGSSRRVCSRTASLAQS